MDLTEWFHLINADAANQITGQAIQMAQGIKQSSTKLIPMINLNPANLNHTPTINSIKILFLLYVLIGLLTKKPQLIAAFFISCLFFECSLFDSYSEAQLYLLTFVTYTYVITCNVFSVKTNLACVIMCLLCLVFAYDAAFYGVNGFYGESKTFVWHSIERLAICCHILVICTTVDVKRISNAIRTFCYSISDISRNSATFTIL